MEENPFGPWDARCRAPWARRVREIAHDQRRRRDQQFVLATPRITSHFGCNPHQRNHGEQLNAAAELVSAWRKQSLWYTDELTKLAALMEEVKRLSPDRQRDVEHVLEAMIEGGTETYHLSDVERQLVDEGLGSRVVSNAELKAFRNRHTA